MVLWLIFGSSFCASSRMALSISSSPRRSSARSPRSVPKARYSAPLLYATAKALGYFFSAFSASANPASSLV